MTPLEFGQELCAAGIILAALYLAASLPFLAFAVSTDRFWRLRRACDSSARIGSALFLACVIVFDGAVGAALYVVHCYR